MTEEPDFEGSLIVEIITYTIYIAWLSTIAAIALYFELSPLPDIQRAVGGPWQGTAAAIGAGVVFIAISQAFYNAIRGQISTDKTSPEEAPAEAERVEKEPAEKEPAGKEPAEKEPASGRRPPKRKKKSRKSKKRK